MLLPLEFQEVGYREVFGLHPSQEDRVVFLGAHEMDMVVPCEPLLLTARGNRIEVQSDFRILAEFQRERLLGRPEEGAVVRLDPVSVGGGQVEACRTFEQDKMGTVPSGDFQHARVVRPTPDALPVEQVGTQRQHRIDRTQPEFVVSLEQVNAYRNRLARVRPPGGHVKPDCMAREEGFDLLKTRDHRGQTDRAQEAGAHGNGASHQKALTGSTAVAETPAASTGTVIGAPSGCWPTHRAVQP